MGCRIMDLQSKDVICIKNGACLGRVCDVEVDTCSGKLNSLIVYGKSRFFGLFGRCDDMIICWEDVEVIGEDTVLVNFEPSPHKRKKGKGYNFFNKLFG